MRTSEPARVFVVLFVFFLWTHVVFGQSSPDLVAAYAFDEGTGTTTADASGNGNNGTLQGATWTSSGKFGKAASFNGSNSWITVNDSNSLHLTSAMTLEAWVYPTANQSGWRAVMQKETDAYFLSASSSDGPLRTAAGGTFNGNVANTISPTALPVDSWSHVALTYDGANLRLYVNGSQVSSRSQSGTIQVTSSPLRIGGNSVYGEYFQGYIDEARIYSQALSQTQIQTDMNTPIGGTTGPSLPVVSSLTCNPSSVNAGSNTTCIVGLSEAAPSGGSVVSLSENNAALSVPSSVTVASGTTSATFTASSSSVNVDTTVTVTATYNSISKTETVTVLGTLMLSSVGCSPSSFPSDSSTTCTATLNKDAPSGGTVVTLSDNSSFLSVPSSVTVASGETSATFTATSSVVSSNQTVTITATFSGVSKTTSVTLQVVTISSLMGAYAFNEGTGTTVTDASGNGNTGTLQGATWTTSGKFGNALSFNGSSSYVDLGNPSELQITGSMTWSAWVYATANPYDDGQIVARSDHGGGKSGWQFKSSPDTGPHTFGVGVSPDGNSITQRYSRTVRSLNTWYHVAGVYNASARTLDIYINGLQDNGTLSGTIPSSQFVPPLNVTIGKRSGGFYFQGAIDEVRIYNRALSNTEIQTDMNTPIGSGSVPTLPTISSLTCNPSSVNAGSNTTCTVGLSEAASSGGSVVSLSENNAALSVPSSVTVASGTTSATFTASSSSVNVDTTVTVTATYNLSSKTATVTVLAPVTLSSVGCDASSLLGGLTTTCTVALNKGAPSGGAVVTLSDNSSYLTRPSSVTVASGATSAAFIATSSVVTSNQTVTITASYDGTSKTDTVTLTPSAPSTPMLTLSSASAAPGSTVSLDLTLSYPSGSAPAGLEWTLSYSTSAFTSVTMTAGPALTAAGKTLTCTSRTGSYECIAVGMNTNNIGAGVVAVASVGLSSSITSSVISVASTYAVSGTGSGITISGASGTITATGLAAPQSITELLTTGSAVARKTEDRSDAAVGYSSAATLTRLDCNPRTVYAGEESTCQMQLDSVQAAGATTLEIASSSGAVKIPPAITTRAGQSILTFRASTDPAAPQEAVILEARLGDSTVQESINILPQDKPVLRVPQAALARFETPVRFTVQAAHSGGLPVELSAEGLPPGGSFVPETGMFEWIPSRAQQGSYDIIFTAATAASSATRHTTIEVGSGEPVLSGSEPAFCSPSAVARLRGKWLSLAASPSSDRSGNSMALGGTRVKVNQQYVPVLYASSTELSVLCPNISPGAALQIAVETESGVSQPVTTTMQEATPMLLTLDESSQGQALIAVSGTGQLAMVRNFKVNTQPAQPNDPISVWATGLGAPEDTGSLQVIVKVGDISVTADSVQSLPGFAGIHQLEARVPSATILGESVPVQIEILRANGQSIRSNTATIAIEPIQP